MDNPSLKPNCAMVETIDRIKKELGDLWLFIRQHVADDAASRKELVSAHKDLTERIGELMAQNTSLHAQNRKIFALLDAIAAKVGAEE